MYAFKRLIASLLSDLFFEEMLTSIQVESLIGPTLRQKIPKSRYRKNKNIAPFIFKKITKRRGGGVYMLQDLNTVLHLIILILTKFNKKLA